MTERLDELHARRSDGSRLRGPLHADDSVQYLWHLGYGLRADRRDGSTILITDPAKLPDGPWRATDLGLEELRDPTLLEPA